MDHDQAVPGADSTDITKYCIPRVPEGDTLWPESVSIGQQQAERLERILSQMQRDLLASSREQLKSDGIAESSTAEGACIALGHADFSELERRVIAHMVTMGSPVRVIIIDENGVPDGVLDLLSKGDRTHLPEYDPRSYLVSEASVGRSFAEMAVSIQKPRDADVRQHPQQSKFAGREWWRRSDKLPRGLRNRRGCNVSDAGRRVLTCVEHSGYESRTREDSSHPRKLWCSFTESWLMARPGQGWCHRKCKANFYRYAYGLDTDPDYKPPRSEEPHRP